MTGRWYRINSDLVNEPRVQRLKPRAFLKAWRAAIRGEVSELSDFIKPCRGRPSGPIWTKLRSTVFARDDYTCVYCGARGGRLECDHVHPVARGGTDDLTNLVTACFTCNRSKRAKTIEEWMAV